MATLERAFVQSGDEPEFDALAGEFERRGVPVERFLAKRLRRRQVPITARTLVAGSVPVVLAALRQLDREPPPLPDYPACLTHLLRRRVWSSTVEAVRRGVDSPEWRPRFVKPLGAKKRFTGRVVHGPYDLGDLAGVSGKLAVLCSEVVEFASEHRAFVLRGEVVGVRRYAGEGGAEPDPDVVRDAVARWGASGEAPAAYALDVGVLPPGETALVEVNDAYGLGAYDLEPARYADLVAARWLEIVEGGRQVPEGRTLC